MMRTAKLFAAISCVSIVGLAASVARAADASPTSLEASPIGKRIENFSLTDYRGKTHQLDELRESKLVAVAFLGVECPLAKVYAPRLEALAEEFKAQGVSFVAIDSNLQDSMTELAAFARIHNVTFPVLKDLDNKIADRFGAVRTPEVFVLDADRVVRYHGRIDDQYGFKTGAGYAKPRMTRRDLAEAISELLAGKPVSEPVAKADGCLIGRVQKVAPHGEVTYTKHIASILQNRCVECHRSGEVAPFGLTSYDEVVGWAPMMREVVSEGRMPPWFANPEHGKFANDARLTDAEKETLFAWIDGGCPQGNASDLPEPRKFTDGWQIKQPDEVIYMNEEGYKVPAEGVVEYQYFTVDPGWTEDKWVQQSECRPGNRSVVHHIIVFVEPPSDGKERSPFGERSGLGGYAPGAMPLDAHEGRATFVPAGSKLRFQMHYTPNGSEQTDRSMIGVVFADPKTVKQRVRGGAAGNVGLRIPAGDGNYEVTAKHKFTRETLLLTLTPHMHLRGKDFRYVLEYPDGTRETLLDVPHWDFNWQLRYDLAEPKLIPAGSKMLCTAHFDNSSDNLANPDPTKEVRFGDQTWEEMMFGFYSSVDPNQNLLAANSTSDKDDDGEGFVGEGSISSSNADKAEVEKK